MHIHCMDSYRHSHVECGDSRLVERRIRWVMGLTIVTMIAEIIAGWAFGSLALLADGWHMASHGLALFIALFALAFARRHSADPKFTFGTGKVDALGGFASALVLGMVAITMVVEAVHRLLNPTEIAYGEAMVVAAVGLVVNLASVLILEPPGEAGHGAGAEAGHSVHATYLHVLADLLTSVGAIVALGAGMMLSWNWLDPMVGLAGAVVIAVWARGLVRDSSGILLDQAPDPVLVDTVRSLIEADADNRVADLHLWSIRAGQSAAIVSVVTHFPRPTDHYKALLAGIPGLGHVTVEVRDHGGEPCLPAGPGALASGLGRG
ncbi:MAG: cation transporter [Rhodospirillaceae bacterium BRH_c57]|nr:MAG: cation transporter [Rhodospirillaceae bacterium BRH_c57]